MQRDGAHVMLMVALKEACVMVHVYNSYVSINSYVYV